MSDRTEDRFRVRPAPPKAQQPRFVSRVLKEANKAGAVSLRSRSSRPGAKFGRGTVASRIAGGGHGARSRRVVIKARLVKLGQGGAKSTATHLRYIARDGVTREGERGAAYGPSTDAADLGAFTDGSRDDRHQFRFIVSPEDAAQLDDLRAYTRALMERMEADLGTRLEWVAVDHWDTDNPHTHIVLRGKDQSGHDLVIAREYISSGMRQRAGELATEWLGPRTELEVLQSQTREVDQQRWTGLDQALKRQLRDGAITLDSDVTSASIADRQNRQLLVGRLQHLSRMGLANEAGSGVWTVRPDAESVLRALGERGDIVRTMQRAMGGEQRELVVSQPAESDQPAHAVVGRVAGKGLADELNDRGYLVIDGIDGRAHYVPLKLGAQLDQYPVGAIVEVKHSTLPRAADISISKIAAASADRLYRVDDHLRQAQSAGRRDAEAHVESHVRRLEALRRTGLVDRVAEGVWKVPADLPQKALVRAGQQLADAEVVVHSSLPIDRQTRAIGATWLDRQLIGGAGNVGAVGFGAAVHQKLMDRADHLVDAGLATRRGTQVILARDLLSTLKRRDVDAAARSIASELGKSYRPVGDGDRASGVYRRNVELSSGRFALLENGLGFSLVPWRPVLESRMGQSMSAVVRGTSASWEFGRQRGPAVA